MNNIKEVKRESSLYPEGLKYLKDPPPVLYCIGDAELLQMPMVAVVGSRKCSEYGKRVSMEIGRQLSRGGIGVVSGMAKGIDSFAHLGALKNGGKTIAVLGCGPDVCYPAENRKIYEQIIQEGLIVAEYEPGTKPMPYRFPQRNRIIAALSEAVVVTEAGTGSGSLITAEISNSLNKTVYSVPGNITSQYSIGTNKLIAEGAMPLFVIEDLIREVGGRTVFERDGRKGLSDDENKVINILEDSGEVTLEYLCVKMGKTPIQMNGIVTVLEMKGYLVCNFGKIFVAKF